MISKLLITGVLAVTPLLALTGCDDNDLAIGVGGAAIGAGAVLIGQNWGHNHHGGHHHGHHNGGWGHGGGHHHGGWGGHHGGWGGGHHGGGHHGHHSLRSLEASNEDVFTDGQWADVYNMTPEAAGVFLSALESSKAGDSSALTNLGFTKSDMQNLVAFQMPSEESLKTVSVALKQDTADTTRMIQDMVNVIKTDAANENGAMWSTCKEAGSWKTDKNLSCENTWWGGCGPATGAKFCTPIN